MIEHFVAFRVKKRLRRTEQVISGLLLLPFIIHSLSHLTRFTRHVFVPDTSNEIAGPLQREPRLELASLKVAVKVIAGTRAKYIEKFATKRMDRARVCLAMLEKYRIAYSGRGPDSSDSLPSLKRT